LLYLPLGRGLPRPGGTMKKKIKKSVSSCASLSPESRYKRIVEGLRREYFFYCHDTGGIFIYVSPPVRNILGYS
jgi:hypothetical protein